MDDIKYDPEWTLATLNDALEALEKVIAEIEDRPEEVEEILDEELVNVYAKLNYAFHSAEEGPNALLEMSEDDIISFPPVLPMLGSPAFQDDGTKN